MDVRFWLLTGAGWLIALSALAALARIPGPSLDLYFRDRYVVVSKLALIGAVTLLLALPLAVATIRHVRLRGR